MESDNNDFDGNLCWSFSFTLTWGLLCTMYVRPSSVCNCVWYGIPSARVQAKIGNKWNFCATTPTTIRDERPIIQRKRKPLLALDKKNNWNSCLLVIYVWGQWKAFIRDEYELRKVIVCDRRTPKKRQTGNWFQCLSSSAAAIHLCATRICRVHASGEHNTQHLPAPATVHVDKDDNINDVGTVVVYARRTSALPRPQAKKINKLLISERVWRITVLDWMQS